MNLRTKLPLLCIALTGCAVAEESTDSATSELREDYTQAGLRDGTGESRAILALVNDRARSAADLVATVGLSASAAEAIVTIRNGANRKNESQLVNGRWELGGDDDQFEKLSEIDVLPDTDKAAFIKLRDYALANDYLACEGEKITSASGVLMSPNWPGTYPNGLAKAWCLIAPAGKQVRLTFSEFATENGYDKLSIFDQGENLLSETSGTTAIPAPATSQRILVRFTTDGTVGSSGWRATWTTQ